MSRDSQRMWQLAARYSGLGIEMAASVVIGAIGGHFADEHLHTTPWLFWVGVIIGFGAAVKAVLRTIRDFKASTKTASRL